MGLLVDTSALVALESAATPWEAALAELGGEAVAVPAVVYAELLAGVELADTPLRAAARRAKIEAVVVRAPIVEFAAGAAAHWAAIFR
jgi:predicted nucleic acid-binding protein